MVITHYKLPICNMKYRTKIGLLLENQRGFSPQIQRKPGFDRLPAPKNQYFYSSLILIFITNGQLMSGSLIHQPDGLRSIWTDQLFRQLKTLVRIVTNFLCKAFLSLTQNMQLVSHSRDKTSSCAYFVCPAQGIGRNNIPKLLARLTGYRLE